MLSAGVAVGPRKGYMRFCSSTMAGPAHGLDRYLYLTGEETNDLWKDRGDKRDLVATRGKAGMGDIRESRRRDQLAIISRVDGQDTAHPQRGAFRRRAQIGEL